MLQYRSRFECRLLFPIFQNQFFVIKNAILTRFDALPTATYLHCLPTKLIKEIGTIIRVHLQPK
jgi:hypothetical protein